MVKFAPSILAADLKYVDREVDIRLVRDVVA
jgi:hypothetical protein